MVIGLLVIGVAATGFRGHARSAELGLALVELQARARYALGEIATGVRSAGHAGCATAAGAIPSLPERRDGAAVARTAWQPLDGFVVTGSGWSPAYPPGYGAGGYTVPTSGAATPVAGSHALLVEGGIGQGSALSGAHVPGGPSLRLASPVPGLGAGALALIGGCTAAEVFRVKRTAVDGDGTLSVWPVAPLVERHEVVADFPLGSRVIPYRRALYFVGETGRFTERREPIRALYEHLHPFVDNAPSALADGVEAMVVRYRQRAADGRSQELGATDADFDPARVTGASIALLISQDAYRPLSGSRPVFVLAGVLVQAGAGGSAPGHPDDARMRRTFERSATVRARSEGVPP